MLMSPVRLAWQVQVVRRGFLAVSARFAGPFAPNKRNHACVTTKVRPRQLLFLKGIKLNAIALALTVVVGAIMFAMLGKNPATTVVTIDEVDMDNWGIGGLPVGEFRAAQAQQETQR